MQILLEMHAEAEWRGQMEELDDQRSCQNNVRRRDGRGVCSNGSASGQHNLTDRLPFPNEHNRSCNKLEGIQCKFSYKCTSEQNGVAKWKNWVIKEATKEILEEKMDMVYVLTDR